MKLTRANRPERNDWELIVIERRRLSLRAESDPGWSLLSLFKARTSLPQGARTILSTGLPSHFSRMAGLRLRSAHKRRRVWFASTSFEVANFQWSLMSSLNSRRDREHRSPGLRASATLVWSLDIFPVGLNRTLNRTLNRWVAEQREGTRMFSLDKLKVYDKALASAASLAQHSRSWDKRHAVTDQLLRASESVVLNLAEGARLRSAGKRQHLLEYGIGSALECAGCLDIAQIKEFLGYDEVLREKRSLCEVVKMMVGLKKAWSTEASTRIHQLWKAGGVAFFPRTAGCLPAQLGIHAVV